MSRFGNLEFGENSGNQEFQEQGQEARDEPYYAALAKAAFEQGDYESALRMYAKVLEFNPQNAAAWTGQVRMLIELGEYREAKLWAEKALERFPREPELLAAKAVALGRTGDLDNALAFSDASIEERGDTPYIWLARGDVLLAREEQRADYCLEKAVILGGRDWFVTWLAARIRCFYKQFAQAIRLFQQAISLNIDHDLLWLELGCCQMELGMAQAARDSFQQARTLNPRRPETANALLAAQSAPVSKVFRGWMRRLFDR